MYVYSTIQLTHPIAQGTTTFNTVEHSGGYNTTSTHNNIHYMYTGFDSSTVSQS